MCREFEYEPYVPNEYTVRIPYEAWRKLNMGVPLNDPTPLWMWEV